MVSCRPASQAELFTPRDSTPSSSAPGSSYTAQGSAGPCRATSSPRKQRYLLEHSPHNRLLREARSIVISRKLKQIVFDILSFWREYEDFDGVCNSILFKVKRMKYATWKNGPNAPFDIQSLQRLHRDVVQELEPHLNCSPSSEDGDNFGFWPWFDRLFLLCLEEVDLETAQLLTKMAARQDQ